MPRFPAQGRARADLAIALSDSSDDEYAIESPGASVASQSPTTFKTRVVAVKEVSVDARAKRKRAVSEVALNAASQAAGLGAAGASDHVLRFYGSYVDDAADAVGLVLEYMDGGSLDQFAGAPELALGCATRSV
ncbi:MAP kinase kinase [Aureococcus anophagefferens]|uniref:MAP kinase kinase n=1 Tax=Aureococcus anophagefferens TaxID=44056 RepID=A0ABR1FN27_AURAN